MQCCDPTFDIALRNAAMSKGIFMCYTDSCSVLCQNHYYPSPKTNAFWGWWKPLMPSSDHGWERSCLSDFGFSHNFESVSCTFMTTWSLLEEIILNKTTYCLLACSYFFEWMVLSQSLTRHNSQDILISKVTLRELPEKKRSEKPYIFFIFQKTILSVPFTEGYLDWSQGIFPWIYHISLITATWWSVTALVDVHKLGLQIQWPGYC